jgi:two-component system, OmpR family, phosphate regulon sensor histidine kinase PhoR
MHYLSPFFPLMWPFSKRQPGSDSKPSVNPEAISNGLNADVVNAFPDPVLVIDQLGNVLMANQLVKAALDADPMGMHLSASIRSPAVLDAVAAVMAGEEAFHVDYDVRFPVPRSFQAYVSPLGGSGGAVIVLRDLTREQQLERTRADFVANASHELRTPLASLSGFIETIQGAARNDGKAQAKFLSLMRSQADRMSRLIDDLLSLSRIEMNEHVRPSTEVDLAQVAFHVRDILSGMAAEAGCQLQMTFDGALPVLGHRDELVQVVQNLVENALKYASSGKLVEVEGHRVNGYVELAVKDHGPGIAEEHIPRLTERFYRVSVQESRSRGGTGLGLAIVKHILNRHRGRLSIASKIGKGSTFTMRIPLKKP